MASLGTPLLVLVFLAAAGTIWVAGVQLSGQTDLLAARLGLGSALGGLILLAFATNLPEIAIVGTAALSGDVGVAVGNILGGIAIQTVVLVALDAGVRGRPPLTHRAASLVPVLEGLGVIAVLAAVVCGTQFPPALIVWRVTPEGLLVAALWVVSLLLIRRAGRGLPWHASGAVDGTRRRRRPAARASDAAKAGAGAGTRRAGSIFAVAAAATLLAGVVLTRSGEVLAGDAGLSGVLFGATVLAAATSLPELSTGLASVRNGDDRLAISDIFGGNAFLPALFLLATLLSGRAVLPLAQDTDIYLTAVGMVLTAVYVTGLVFRPTRRIAGLGVDSLVVLVLYGLAVAGLFAIAGSG